MSSAAYKRKRYASDPKYRAKEAARNLERRANNPEYKKKASIKARERYANDPGYFAAWHRMRKYGLDEPTYRGMLAACDYCCQICKTAFDDENINLRPVIDHCHRTNRVRGILCQSCNLALSKLMDDPTLLRAAASYLENQPQTKEKSSCQ